MQKYSLSSILLELFDTEAPIRWDVSGDSFVAKFKAPNEITYKIEIESISNFGTSEEFDNAAVNAMSQETFDSFIDQGYHVEFSDTQGGQGITGAGGKDTAKVFGIILNAIVSKVKEENIGYFFFTAEEPSRKALYKRMVPMIANKLGYEHATDGTYFFVSRDSLNA
jgi:hypothetical protein